MFSLLVLLSSARGIPIYLGSSHPVSTTSHPNYTEIRQIILEHSRVISCEILREQDDSNCVVFGTESDNVDEDRDVVRLLMLT